MSQQPDRLGPFRIIGRLGAGGMAEAFVGLRTGPGGFEQRVCVKRVLPAYGKDDEFVRLFLREARLAAVLSHRNITRVLEFGEDHGAYYLALELVEGTDLRHLLKLQPERRLSPSASALIGIEIADALEHAHTRRGATGPVIHRDVSPANILVSCDGDVKLTDFGISKALGDVLASRSEFVRGNVWYMAPEQLRLPGFADPRSDLFSLGIVLCQCLSGRRPYDAPTDLSAMMALSEGRRIPLDLLAPDLPAPLVDIIERLLAQEPEHRFQSARETSEALAACVSISAARAELRKLASAAISRPRAAPEVPAGVTQTDVDVGDTPQGPTRALRAQRVDSGASEAPTRGAPSTRDQTSGAWSAAPPPASPPPAAQPARWAPYNYAPGIWAAADALPRKSASKPAATSEDTAPRLPIRWRVLPLALAAFVLGVLLFAVVAMLR